MLAVFNQADFRASKLCCFDGCHLSLRTENLVWLVIWLQSSFWTNSQVECRHLLVQISLSWLRFVTLISCDYMPPVRTIGGVLLLSGSLNKSVWSSAGEERGIVCGATRLLLRPAALESCCRGEIAVGALSGAREGPGGS